eukprot:scaffold2004_cov420-Prasinococcus_capsulatus_cf.AAC.1
MDGRRQQRASAPPTAADAGRPQRAPMLLLHAHARRAAGRLPCAPDAALPGLAPFEDRTSSASGPIKHQLHSPVDPSEILSYLRPVLASVQAPRDSPS